MTGAERNAIEGELISVTGANIKIAFPNNYGEILNNTAHIPSMKFLLTQYSNTLSCYKRSVLINRRNLCSLIRNFIIFAKQAMYNGIQMINTVNVNSKNYSDLFMLNKCFHSDN